MSYDAVGNLRHKIDGRGYGTTYAYDARARLRWGICQDGSRVTRVYDAASQLIGISDSLGDWSRTYNPVGWLYTDSGPTHPNGQALTHDYDARGHRTVLETWFGRLTSSYDARGSVKGLVDPRGGLSTWNFDPVGQMVDRYTPESARTTVSYDGAGRPTGTRHSDQSGMVLDYALLTHDTVGNPLAKATRDGLHSMSYDATNQLLSEYHPLAGVKTWSYDPAGNRLSQDWTQAGMRTLTFWSYDPADQLVTEMTESAVTTFIFDGAGNRLLEQAPDGVTTNVWDSENRLVETELPNGVLNTMSYRALDGLRASLSDSEGSWKMVWDTQGSSGHPDLLEETGA